MRNLESMSAENVSKSYSGKNVLKNINLSFTKGITGLLGENGAGKSTLIKIISGEIKNYQGKIFLNGKESENEQIYNYLGYLPQDFTAPKDITINEYLNYISEYKGNSNPQKSIIDLSDILRMGNYLHSKIGTLSGGTLQKVGIAQAFINNPQLVVLDEPTKGLDITQRRDLKEFLIEKSLRSLVIISTHIVSDIDYICNDLIILKNGAIVSSGAYKNQIKELKDKVWEIICSEDEISEISKRINSFGGVISNIKSDESFIHTVRFISEKKVFEEAVLKQGELNDYYLWKVGKINA